tara:strand:+ start:580 stop:1137 length:558 start_codon:yes stop_codon:yes gene_type:complete
MIFSNYHIKHKILTSVIAPHGITDLFHAVQNNNTKQLLSMNAVFIATSFELSQHDVTMLGLNFFFLVSSLVHFRHDFPVFWKNNNQEFQQYILSLVTILSFTLNQELFFWYMCFIHVPHHYYSNRRVIKKSCVLNLSFILFFSLLLMFIGQQYAAFEATMIPLYKGIVISHIVYQEVYVHPTLSN